MVFPELGQKLDCLIRDLKRENKLELKLMFSLLYTFNTHPKHFDDRIELGHSCDKVEKANCP